MNNFNILCLNTHACTPHTHTHTHTHAHTHACTHAHTHTHTHTGVQLIKDLADEVDKLTPQVVAAALDVRKTPEDKSTRRHLDSLRKEWAGKVQELTTAIDDIIDPKDFMAVSGEVVCVCVCCVRTSEREGKGSLGVDVCRLVFSHSVTNLSSSPLYSPPPTHSSPLHSSPAHPLFSSPLIPSPAHSSSGQHPQGHG